MICMKKAMLALALALAMVACAVVVTDESDAIPMEDGIDYSIGETANVTGYSGDSDVVKIPAEIEYENKTVAVVGISAEAFKKSNITEVIIPSSVTYIGSNAFYQSEKLEFVTIEGSATIESSAFEGCTSLKFIDFKKEPVSIGEGSFYLGSQNSCTYRAPENLSLEQYGNGTTFDYIGVDQYIIRYVTVDAPEGVGDIEFDIVKDGAPVTIPDAAKVTGYDIAATIDGEPIGEDYKISKSDIVLTLTYSFHKYIVDFSVDGEIIKSDPLDYQALITAPEDPKKAPDAQYIYTFSHWATPGENGITYKEGLTVEQAMDYHFEAVFTTTLQKYTIEFMVDGKIVKSQVLEYGTLIELPGDPDDKTVEGIDYIFHHWNPYISGMTVTGDVTFTAQFVESDHEYIIKFVVDGQTVKTEKLHYKDEITAPEDPVKEDADGIRYTFTGWEGYNPGMTVTEDATFNAVFSESPVDDGSGSTWIIIVVVVIVVILLALVFLRKFL